MKPLALLLSLALLIWLYRHSHDHTPWQLATWRGGVPLPEEWER